MPEFTEHIAATAYLQKCFDTAGPGTDWTVRKIWYDATMNEEEQFPDNSRARQGLPIELTRARCVMRGQTKRQTALWPHTVQSDNGLQALKLVSISGTFRSIILDFGFSVFSVSLYGISSLLLNLSSRQSSDSAPNSYVSPSLSDKSLGRVCTTGS